ncbi:restriction endonuclease EcoprrI, partial [Achromatium sp. WMS1]
MIDYTKTIAEANNFIILDQYTQNWQVNERYQSEYDLEGELIHDLQNQGYEYIPSLNTPTKMLDNVRIQLQNLNNTQFLDDEWQRFITQYLDNPSDN